jgi:PilZ domain
MATSRGKEQSKPTLTQMASKLDTRKRPITAAPGESVRAEALRWPEKRAHIQTSLARQVERPAVSRRAVAAGPVASAPKQPSATRSDRKITTTLRADALQNIRAVAPTKAVRGPQNKRNFPRAPVGVRAQLRLSGDDTRRFEASLPASNVSVGGLFFESTFFLKLGTQLEVDLTLPPEGRVVQVTGEVVRVETKESVSGFAIRFLEYLNGSEVVLATHFLSPVLRAFLTEYANKHHFSATPDFLAHTADTSAAWELEKAASGGDVWSLATQT